jgi:hypothetical protein
MATLGFVLAAFLDPIQAGIVLAVVLVHRGALPIIVAGLGAALVSESVMALAADDYVWGELIVPRITAALLQAAVLWCVVHWLRSLLSRRSAAHSGSGATAGSAAAGFAPVGGRRALPPTSAAAPHK